MMDDAILVERRDDVAVLTINRPDKRNAVPREGWHRIADLAEELGADSAMRCLVLRGAGTEAFTAGADIGRFEIERSSLPLVEQYTEATKRCFHVLRHGRVPAIAMIHGFCLGGGFEMALACDLRISGRSGRFGIPAKSVGLYLSWDLVELLVDVAGTSTALELLLEGRVLAADEALAKGLVTRVVDDTVLESEVMATARRIADGAPLAAAWHRAAVHRVGDAAPYNEAELEAQHDYAETADYKEGFAAFLRREKPVFRGG
jgi:enoyl-CoA hydratase/carnithine racemase